MTSLLLPILTLALASRVLVASNQITVVNFFNEGDTNKGKIEETSNLLKDCGYNVEVITANTTAEATTKLKERQLESGSVVFIDSHAQLRDRITKEWYTDDLRRGVPGVGAYQNVNELMMTGTQAGKDKIVGEAESFLSDVNELAPNLRLWMDTCHGGACLNKVSPAMCIGATCGIMESAPVGPKMRKIFVDLLCDAKKGCEKWRKVDANGDGKIDAEELNDHLINAMVGEKVRVTDIVSRAAADDLAKQMKRKGGRVTSSQAVGYPVQVHYQKVEIGKDGPPKEVTTSLYMLGELTKANDRISLKTVPAMDMWDYLAMSKERAEVELRRVFPEWPKCGEYGGTKQRSRLENCSVELGSELFYEVHYEFVSSSFRVPGQPTFRPQPNTFSLAATQCATRTTTPHSVKPGTH